MFHFITSVILFVFAFIGTRIYKLHPIFMIVLCGLAGLLIF
jgi:chromate transporter